MKYIGGSGLELNVGRGKAIFWGQLRNCLGFSSKRPGTSAIFMILRAPRHFCRMKEKLIHSVNIPLLPSFKILHWVSTFGGRRAPKAIGNEGKAIIIISFLLWSLILRGIKAGGMGTEGNCLGALG